MAEAALVVPNDVKNLPAHVKNAAGRGNEALNASNLIIPRLKQIQSLSAERDKHSPKFIQGADEGMFFNSATGELYPEEISLVSLKFKESHVIWAKRGTPLAGAPKGTYENAADAEAAMSEMPDNKDLYVQETHDNLVLLALRDKKNELTGEFSDPMVFSMASSKLRTSRRWNSLANSRQGDRFSTLYTVKSARAESKMGTYQVIEIDAEGWLPDSMYELAEAKYTEFLNVDFN